MGRSPLGGRPPRPCGSLPADAEPHGPANHPVHPRPSRAPPHVAGVGITLVLLFAQDHEGGLALAGQAGEADGHSRGQRPGPVEHDQAKRAAAQQDVGAPRPGAPGARVPRRPGLPSTGRCRGGRWRAHDPEATARSQRGPVGRGERAPGIDVGNPTFVRERLRHDLAHQRRLAAPAPSHDLRQPPAWEPPARQDGIERRDPRGEPAPGDCGELRGDDGGQLLAKRGERHGRTGTGGRAAGDE